MAYRLLDYGIFCYQMSTPTSSWARMTTCIAHSLTSKTGHLCFLPDVPYARKDLSVISCKVPLSPSQNSHWLCLENNLAIVRLLVREFPVLWPILSNYSPTPPFCIYLWLLTLHCKLRNTRVVLFWFVVTLQDVVLGTRVLTLKLKCCNKQGPACWKGLGGGVGFVFTTEPSVATPQQILFSIALFSSFACL